MAKKIIFSLASILVLTTSASYAMNEEDDLKLRQTIVNKQLELHKWTNEFNGSPKPTFYEAIEEAEKFEPMGGLPPIGPNTPYFREVNKQANKAKHDWNNPVLYMPAPNVYNNPNKYTVPGTYIEDRDVSYSQSYSGNNSYPHSSSSSVTHRYQGSSHANGSDFLDDCRRIHQQSTGRSFDRDVQDNCVIQ